MLNWRELKRLITDLRRLPRVTVTMSGGAEAAFHHVKRFLADVGAIALAQLAVELADVRAFELDDVDEDQGEVGLELADGIARGKAELLDVVRELADG